MLRVRWQGYLLIIGFHFSVQVDIFFGGRKKCDAIMYYPFINQFQFLKRWPEAIV